MWGQEKPLIQIYSNKLKEPALRKGRRLYTEGTPGEKALRWSKLGISQAQKECVLVWGTGEECLLGVKLERQSGAGRPGLKG